MDWTYIGRVEHYFDKIGVAAIELEGELAVGDWIGFVRDDELLFEQEVTSMQVERQDIDYAEPGDNVGIKVTQEVKVNTEVYRGVQ